MRWLNKRSFGTLLVLSVLTLFLAAACTGSEGDRGSEGPAGSKGDTGAQGAKGDKGDKGDNGARGDTGAKGDTGATGATGDTGPAGPTIPTSIVVVPVGTVTTAQPAMVLGGADNEVKIVVYGSGFPAGEFVSVALIGADGEETVLTRSSGDSAVNASGAFTGQFSAPATKVVDPGVYTVNVATGPSGIQASAPLVVVLTK